MPKMIIGIMGPGDNARENDMELAHTLGTLIAQNGWVLLTGGRNVGVMNAASMGAQEAGGITVGILPDEDTKRASQFVDISILTGMGSARNNINILSSDVVVACGLGAGTLSEIMLAIKSGKPLLLLSQTEEAKSFLKEMGYDRMEFYDEPQEVISRIRQLV